MDRRARQSERWLVRLSIGEPPWTPSSLVYYARLLPYDSAAAIARDHMNKPARPVYLNIFQFSFPLPAIASITHRISGVVLFAGMALLLYLLDVALASDAGFGEAASLMATPVFKWAVWLVLAALIFHLVGGIRHLLMDFHIGDTLQGGRLGSQLMFAVSAVLIVLAGAWLW